MLARAAAALLYQYDFTGYVESDLAKIPPTITVANTPQSSVPIAEYVIAGILEWVTGLRQMDAEMRSCTWKSGPPGNTCKRSLHRQVSNATIGILGYGHIGEAIATRAAAFGARLIATTLPPLPPEPPKPLSWLGDDSMNARLFRESDFVVVCTPLTNTTRGLVNASLLAALGADGVIINIARGPVVDEEALFRALSTKAVGGAILDVWWNSIFELPPGGVGPSSWPSAHRFDQLPNVIMSPHESGNTPQSRDEAITEVAQNLDNIALGRPLENVVRKGKRP